MKTNTSLYQQDIAEALSATAGGHGLENKVFDALLAETARARTRIGQWHDDRSLPLLRLPEATDDLDRLEAIAKRIRAGFDDVVIFGTGGSSLGGQTLAALVQSPLMVSQPRLHFVDNIDPDTIDLLLAYRNLERTLFLVVSKSGGTGETISQFLIAWQAVCDRLGNDKAAKHFLLIAENADNPLRRMSRRWKLEALDHDPGVGGRFSVLSLVGLLPALIAGVDVRRVRRGALAVLRETLEAEALSEVKPAVGAALAVGLERHQGVRTSVIMPYSDRLAHFGLWYRQLWAESLGKAGHGTTPVRALGTVDQHSQLQLYLDGPADKMFTMIMPAHAGRGIEIPAALTEDPALDYLKDRKIGDLFDAMQRATAETLARKGRPVRLIRIERVNAETLGALLMHFMLETIFAADLLGVDAFDQPAVEDGKVLAREYLAMMGN